MLTQLVRDGQLALLTTTGARSGRPHTVPLGFVSDGDRVLVVASAGGAPHHPAWFHNLVANPLVTLETNAGSRAVIAVPATGTERDRLFGVVLAVAPDYADYERQSGRTLPVVVLHPTDGDLVRTRAAGDELVELHDWFRQELANLRAGAPAGAGNLREHCLTFCGGLHRHHMGEEYLHFTFLEERFPELRPALDELRAEHVKVDRLRAELQALVERGDPAPADFDQLAADLTAHLDREERLLVPLLNALPEVPWPRFG